MGDINQTPNEGDPDPTRRARAYVDHGSSNFFRHGFFPRAPASRPSDTSLNRPTITIDTAGALPGVAEESQPDHAAGSHSDGSTASPPAISPPEHRGTTSLDSRDSRPT